MMKLKSSLELFMGLPKLKTSPYSPSSLITETKISKPPKPM